jgi:hypothetical protein
MFQGVFAGCLSFASACTLSSPKSDEWVLREVKNTISILIMGLTSESRCIMADEKLLPGHCSKTRPFCFSMNPPVHWMPRPKDSYCRPSKHSCRVEQPSLSPTGSLLSETPTKSSYSMTVKSPRPARTMSCSITTAIMLASITHSSAS